MNRRRPAGAAVALILALVAGRAAATEEDGAPVSVPPAVAPEAGLATLYSDRFQGRRTASGRPYDRNGLTAAHKSLPFGTRVRVTNLRNGRSVVVTINDRGPVHPDRIIDLSRRAARVIGMARLGRAPVHVDILD